MTKLTTELLEKFVSDIKTDGMCDITDSQVESALIRLLAYEQAAKNPAAWVASDECGFPEYNTHNEFSDGCGVSTPLYAAPVLPKQPEPVVLYMGRELISKEGLELIRDGVSEATQLESMCMASAILGGGYPAQPVIPEQPHRISDDDLVAVPRSVLACAGYALRNSQLKDGNVYAELRTYRFAPSITAQPVSEPKAVGYFSYGSECGFDWHKTEKEAIESAEAAIDDYRGDACDGWSEETDSVCWGAILQQATKVDERPRADDDKCVPAIDTVCDYALLPEQESE